MFPGTSVIQTRARYYLFIPWAYQAAKATGRTGDAFVAKSNEIERDLVLTLIREEPELGKGVIGRRVGRHVNTLPSASTSIGGVTPCSTGTRHRTPSTSSNERDGWTDTAVTPYAATPQHRS